MVGLGALPGKMLLVWYIELIFNNLRVSNLPESAPDSKFVYLYIAWLFTSG